MESQSQQVFFLTEKSILKFTQKWKGPGIVKNNSEKEVKVENVYYLTSRLTLKQ